MKKVYIKKLISLVMVLLVIFPVLVSASSPSSIIKKVYFQDEAGNMVFVDYEAAINQSLNDDHTLYNGIKLYVGIAEAKGKSIYLETNTGKVLDFKLAMSDNLFRLEDIIGKSKYEVNHEIVYTHELKVVDGVAVIAPKSVDIDTDYTINITGPGTLKLGETGNFDVRAYGNGRGNVNYRAIYEYAVTGGTGRLEYLDGSNWREIPLSGNFGHTDGFMLTPNWDITTKLRFTPATEGTYYVDLSLKDLDKNKTLANAEHTLIVTKRVEEPAELVSITPVNGIEVDFGTSLSEAIGRLQQTTTIVDSKGAIHTVNLGWTIGNYNGNIAGEYTGIGRFELPEGIQNSEGLELKVETIVKVVAPVVSDWPIEVEDVFVGKSQITNITYANIEIKEEYLSIVEAVYVDDILAINMADKPSQWRIEVGDGTTVEQLMGKVRAEVEESEVVDKSALAAAISTANEKVEADYTPETWTPFAAALTAAIGVNDNVDATQEDVNAALLELNTRMGALMEKPSPTVAVEVRNSSPMLPMLLQLKVDVTNIPSSAKFDVVYQLSGGTESHTGKYDLGTWTTESIFFNPKTITDKITVRIYDATGENLLHRFTDVVIVNPMIPK